MLCIQSRTLWVHSKIAAFFHLFAKKFKKRLDFSKLKCYILSIKSLWRQLKMMKFKFYYYYFKKGCPSYVIFND